MKNCIIAKLHMLIITIAVLKHKFESVCMLGFYLLSDRLIAFSERKMGSNLLWTLAQVQCLLPVMVFFQKLLLMGMFRLSDSRNKLSGLIFHSMGWQTQKCFEDGMLTVCSFMAAGNTRNQVCGWRALHKKQMYSFDYHDMMRFPSVFIFGVLT